MTIIRGYRDVDQINAGEARGRLSKSDPDSERFDIDSWLEEAYELSVNGGFDDASEEDSNE